jgi:two-component system phosphate regulon sensor histidine kinase PhoR
VRVTESLLMTLADGYAGPLSPDQQELLHRAQRRLSSLHALVDDLLDLAAGKAQMTTIDRKPVDLRAAVAEAVERFQPVAREKGISLTVGQPDEALTVLCDPADVERIVVNLISNAVKYTTQGGVTVTLGREADGIRLEVADTGIGIPADALPHLFREFYRAGNAKATEESGTGLGLSIIKLLLERYGGRASVESELGKGTTFVVTIPSA